MNTAEKKTRLRILSRDAVLIHLHFAACCRRDSRAYYWQLSSFTLIQWIVVLDEHFPLSKFRRRFLFEKKTRIKVTTTCNIFEFR